MTSIDILQKLPCGHYESLWHADVQESHETLKTDGKVVAIVPAAFFVVRTNTWKNFAKDLILPTVINHAIKVEGFIEKVFAILRALILDVLASPIRLLTALPIMYLNSQKEVSPLLKVLLNNQVDEKLIESGHAIILRQWKSTKQGPSSDETGAPQMQNNWIRTNANFIDVPTYEAADFEAGVDNNPLTSHYSPN